MNANELYNRMETDFRLSLCKDFWEEMDFNEYITNQYRERYMGLVTDNTDKINYAYTAVFPSQAAIDKIINDGRREALLFVHHPMQWDINKTPVFSDIPIDSLRELRERKISIYNLHVPLDANGTYGTTYNLAAALGIGMDEEFDEYGGVYVGVIGKTEYRTINELKQRFETAVGHDVKLYSYGEDFIKNNTVALVAGGGNEAAVYPLLREKGINTFLTGIARQANYQPSIDAHNAAKENGVNILAGTHYSTEKFACMKMVEYFARQGILSEFVPDTPCMEDM